MMLRIGTLSAVALLATACDSPPEFHEADTDSGLTDAQSYDSDGSESGEADEPPPPGLSPDIEPQQIMGGFSYDSERDVKVFHNGMEHCSGTLLRNDVVLTARHCVTDTGYVVGTVVAPGFMAVGIDGPGDSFGDFLSVAQIADMGPDADVALMLLQDPATIEGRDAGESTEIWSQPDALLLGKAALCQGYGSVACAYDEDGDHEGAAPAPGYLRGGLVVVSVINEALDWINYKALPGYLPTGKWLPSGGDSGSSCRVPWQGAPNRKRVVGVMTEGTACSPMVPQVDEWAAYEVQPSVFRAWAQSQMNQWAGDYFDSFLSPQPYDVVEPAVMSGGPSDWFAASGWLLQNSNAYVAGPEYEGTKSMHAGEVMENGSVRVDVFSHDDDGAGLVLRMRDDTHYYRLSFDEQRSFARIVRRDGSTWTTLAEDTNFSIDWYGWRHLEFQASGNVLTGYVDGVQVLSAVDDDWTYTAGRTGVYSWGLYTAYFDNFEVDRE